MSSKYRLKECIKCSAPLTQKDDELICEYCGARYELPEGYRRKPPQPTPPKPAPPTSASAAPSSNAASKTKNVSKQKKTSCGLILILSLALIIGGGLLILLFNAMSGALRPDPLSEEDQFREEIFSQNSTALADIDFIFGKNFYLSAAMKNATYEDFYFSVSLKNRTDIIIDADSKANNLLVDSVTVSDNTGRQYDCEFTSDVSGYEEIEPGEITRLSSIYCDGGILPEVKYLTLNLKTVNWGTFDFEMSVLPALDQLQIRYVLRRQDDEFAVDAAFYSDPPQFVSFYFDDITVIDSLGTVYVPHRTGDFWHGDLVFFSGLIGNTSHGKDIMLSFDQPFPDAANSITVNLTINGQTITTTAPVDTMEGEVIFIREPGE